MGALRGRRYAIPQRPRRLAASVCGEPGIGPRLGTERGREPAEVLRDHRDVLVLEARREVLHDRVLASALAVLLERAHQVVLVLTRERGVQRRDGDAVLAVARDA